MDYVQRRENKVVFYAPNIEKYGDIYHTPVFYNPLMEKNRTLSVLLLKALGVSGLTVCEPLAGTGVRGVRYAVETGLVNRLILGDVSSKAVELIRKNLELNGIDGEVYNEDANVLLHRLERTCDVVDIDPFGSPAPYMQAAFRAVREEGVICATATDTAVLVGRYWRKCLRRYGSLVKKTPFYIELGIRNLLGYIARVAASEDFAIYPLLSYWESHYFRTCVAVVGGARDADDMFNKLGYVEYRDRYRNVRRYPNSYTSGPLWIAELGNPLTVHKMANYGPHSEFLRLLEEEYVIEVPWFFRLPEFAVNGRSPTLKEALARLAEAGIYATRTHMASDGIKAEGNYGDLMRIFL